MKLQYSLQKTMNWLIALGLSGMLAACSVFGPEVVDHSFGFDLRQDNQDAVVLDYHYGASKLPVYAPEWAVKEGKIFTFDSVGGPMLRGDFLYVKWRNRNTRKVYEDTVDLRHRLPRNIKGQEVYFMIYGPQLFVYLISPERRPPDMPVIGPRAYRSRKIIMIYPDHIKQ